MIIFYEIYRPHRLAVKTFYCIEAFRQLYRVLKESSLSQVGKENVNDLYDALIAIKTSSPEINAVIDNFPHSDI